MSDSYTVPVLSFFISITVATIGFLFIRYFSSFMPNVSRWIIGISAIILLTSLSYILSTSASIFRQFSVCKKVNFSSAALSNTVLIGTVGVSTFLLFLENIPIYKYIFGEFAPRDPYTGEELAAGSDTYMKAMASEKHYKIQFFSSMVKSVLPVYLEEDVKEGIAYMYWVFWMTILPSFFILSMQGTCS